MTIPPEETTGGGGGQGGSATVGTVPMDPRVPKIRIKTRQLAQVSIGFDWIALYCMVGLDWIGFVRFGKRTNKASGGQGDGGHLSCNIHVMLCPVCLQIRITNIALTPSFEPNYSYSRYFLRGLSESNYFPETYCSCVYSIYSLG